MIRAGITAALGRRFFNCTAELLGLIVLILLPSGSSAQDSMGWEAEYDFRLNLGMNRKFKSRLITAENRSVFYWGNAVDVAREASATDFHLTLEAKDSVGSYTYCDRATSLMITQMPPLAGRDIQVCEVLPEIRWELTGKSRLIGPYTCEEARGVFRGRTYIAWFTLEVPVPFGPWKLQGLPGLIVYARDESGEIIFSLDRLQSSEIAITAIEAKNGCMDLQSFAAFQVEWAENLIRRMNAKLPRGSRMELGKQNTMERFE